METISAAKMAFLISVLEGVQEDAKAILPALHAQKITAGEEVCDRLGRIRGHLITVRDCLLTASIGPVGVERQKEAV